MDCVFGRCGHLNFVIPYLVGAGFSLRGLVRSRSMQLGKIVGTVVSTKKDEKLEGLKLQIVKFINADCSFTGGLVVAVDSVGAGVGEVVLVAAGSSARQTEVTKDKPVDTVIMAIVDELDVDGKTAYSK